MKKIFGLTVAALMVMGLIGGGTWAFFSDVETATGNILTAGTLDLTLGGETGVLSAEVTDVYPGQGETTAVTAAATLTKNGTLSGELDIAFDTNITNTESVDTSELGVTYDEDGAGGEVGANALIALYIDVNGGGWDNAADIGLASDDSKYNFGDVTAISATSDASASTTVLTDSDHGAAADALVGMMLQLTVADEARLITGNTTSTITVTDPFSANIGTVAYTVETLKWDAIDDYESAAWTNVYSGNMVGPDEFTILYRVPTSVGNDCQGDGVDFTIDFTLQQTP